MNQSTDNRETPVSTLREESGPTDITVRIQKCEYDTHKAVLVANSAYFEAMFSFNKNLVEPQNNAVTIESIPSIGFKVLLNYMYTAELELTEENIQDVLEVAVYLQTERAINKCSEYLGKRLNYENCAGIVEIAETFTLKKLKTAAYTYICGNLSRISEYGLLDIFSPMHVENILKFDLPVDCTEADVLHIVMKWFYSGPDKAVPKRLRHLKDILKYVRFEEISQTKIDEMLDNIRTTFGNKAHDGPLHQALLGYILSVNSRGMALAVVKVGGLVKHAFPKPNSYCFINRGKWQFFPEICNYDDFHYGSVVINNNLYIAGGYLEGTAVNCTYKYNPMLDTWTKLKGLQTSRRDFTLTACDGKLYAIGGVIEDGNAIRYIKTCERFDLTKGTWEYIDPLPVFRSYHTAATISIDGVHRIYVSGGEYNPAYDTISRTFVFNSRIHYADVHCYEIHLNTWRECSRMPTPRKDHLMFGHGKKLYVCGGHLEHPVGIARPVSAIEAYDCLADTWEVITDIPRMTYHVGIVPDGNKIYIVRYKENFVDCYDVLTGEWTLRVNTVQMFFWYRCYAKLYVPKIRDPKYKNEFL